MGFGDFSSLGRAGRGGCRMLTKTMSGCLIAIVVIGACCACSMMLASF